MVIVQACLQWILKQWRLDSKHSFWGGVLSVVLAAILCSLGVAAFYTFGAYLLMTAWNWTGVGVLHQHPFTFTQAFGLLILLGFVFWFVERIAAAIRK